MSRMSEQHDDLTTVHAILLGQRKVAQDKLNEGGAFSTFWRTRRDAIDDLLLEFEAAGVVWPDNVVEGQWESTGMFEEEYGDQDG